MTVSVSNGESVVWERSLHGLAVGLVDGPDAPIVLVLSQSRGAGQLSDQRVTLLHAYAIKNDTAIWQIELPGTPHLFAQISEDLIVVPVGSTMHAIDVASGAVSWVSEFPSAGQTGSYNLPGTFRFINAGSTDTAIAIGRAERPNRD